MNVSYLFIALLCAALGCSRSEEALPLGLFVKNGSHWIPLSTRIEEPFRFLILNSSAPPKEFITENGYIKTLDVQEPQFVGFFLEMLFYGPKKYTTRYSFDHESKIIHQTFFNCKYDYPVIKSFNESEECDEVDLYLLPFDTYTYLPIPIVFPSRKIDAPGTSYVFGYNANGMTFLLSGIEDTRAEIGYFVDEVTLNPLVVTYEDTHTDTQNTLTHSSVGFYLDFLSYGPGIESYSWKLDEANKIENTKFYLCSIPDNMFDYLRMVTVQQNFTYGCPEVDLYLWEYDTQHGRVIKPHITEENDKHIAAQLDDEWSNYLSSSLKFPYGFFAKIGEDYFPLVGHYFSGFDNNHTALTYDTKSTIPTRFIYQDEFAFCGERTASGYVGIMNKGLSFGLDVPRIKLKLDAKSKLGKYQYYSCSSIKHIRVILTSGEYYDCFKVDIYFVALNKKTGLPLEHF